MSKNIKVRQLFDNDIHGKIWVDGEPKFADSKILLTVSNSQGEETLLITPNEIAKSNPKLFVQAPPERVLTPNRIRQQKFQRFITFIGYGVSAVLITFSLLSVSGFVKARIVLTGSMEPAIKAGDIVLLQPTKNLELKTGDIIAYTGRRFSGEAVGTFTHRIIGGDSKKGFIVKGDANPNPDVQQPTKKDVTGKVFFIIPLLGHVLTPKFLMILAPIALGVWLVFDTLRGGS